MADAQLARRAAAGVVLAEPALDQELRRADERHRLTDDPADGAIVRALSWLLQTSPVAPMSLLPLPLASAQLDAELAQAQGLVGLLRDDDDFRWAAYGVVAALMWATGRTIELPAEQVAAAFAAVRRPTGEPEWVRPAPWAVFDAQVVLADRLVGASIDDSADLRDMDGGSAAALAWVTGRSGPPVSMSRQPATERTAKVELLVALEVSTPVEDESYRSLGSIRRRPRAVSPSFANGAANMLAWLVGVSDRPPVQRGTTG
jgi:hypothetical protein